MISVKVCGITRTEDARYAEELGAAAIGFIFYPGSPRYLTFERAGDIASQLSSDVKKVGVFVNESLPRIQTAIQTAGLDYVQLHGSESADFCRQISIPVIKAFRVQDDSGIPQLEAYDVHGYLFDAYVKGKQGGTGQSFQWTHLQNRTFSRPIILAGGLDAQNIHKAIRTVLPDAVDVSSGVEDHPGVKNHDKMKEFFEAVKDMKYTRSTIFMNNSREKPVTYQAPDAGGHYGQFGGKYVPETLIPALEELESVYAELKDDPEFGAELDDLNKNYAGRPSPLTYAPNISKELGIHIYLKREDLNHTGAHKINNTLGQILLARKMGKTRIIAETGAGQHGVATATVAAKFGMECAVYMGEEDIRRQRLNVFRMELLGAEVRPVSSGSRTLKDATNEAIRDWVSHVEHTHYIIGSVVGPHPYPMMVRDFQCIIGDETRQQFRAITGDLPDALVACVGGGSNAIGMFYPFLDTGVAMYGVEASGHGVDTDKHAATLARGSPGIFHGAASILLHDSHGQVQLPHSISAGLDYPGVGPEHSYLKSIDRVQYLHVTDDEAVAAFRWLSGKEGIIPALESAHALAVLRQQMVDLPQGAQVILCLSGRGDKDVETVAEYLGRTLE